MPNESQPEWIEYWNELVPILDSTINSMRVPEAEDYLTKAFAYYSFKSEKLLTQVKNHKDLVHSVLPLIIQVQDMLRSNIFFQQNLLLAGSAFNLRVGFEIRANLLYIYKHNDPAKMLQRLAEFVEYEKLSGRKQIPSMAPTKEEESEFASKHPYWEDSRKKGTLLLNAKWNGEGKSLYKICEYLATFPEYQDMLKNFPFSYSQTSVFIHGSPLTRNLYTHPKHGLNPIPQARHVVINCLRGTHLMMQILEDFMVFFGIDHQEKDLAFIHNSFMNVQKVLKS